MGQQESVEEGDGAEDSEEGGVSSIVSSTEQPGGQGRPARARQAIVWEDQSSSGTTSSSPQRQARAERGARGGSVRGTTARPKTRAIQCKERTITLLLIEYNNFNR